MMRRLSAPCLVLASAGAVLAQTPCPNNCGSEYAPVCGSDSVTYPNACALNVASCSSVASSASSITLVNQGDCGSVTVPIVPAAPATPTATPTPAPQSKPEAKPEAKPEPSKTVVAPNPAPTDKCAKACTKENEPVCASNGKTYNNECLFEVAKCQHPEITITKEGACVFKYPDPRYVPCANDQDCARQLGGAAEDWNCGGDMDKCIKAGCRLDARWQLVRCVNDCRVEGPSDKGMCTPAKLPPAPTTTTASRKPTPTVARETPKPVPVQPAEQPTTVAAAVTATAAPQVPVVGVDVNTVTDGTTPINSTVVAAQIAAVAQQVERIGDSANLNVDNVQGAAAADMLGGMLRKLANDVTQAASPTPEAAIPAAGASPAESVVAPETPVTPAVVAPETTAAAVETPAAPVVADTPPQTTAAAPAVPSEVAPQTSAAAPETPAPTEAAPQTTAAAPETPVAPATAPSEAQATAAAASEEVVAATAPEAPVVAATQAAK